MRASSLTPCHELFCVNAAVSYYPDLPMPLLRSYSVEFINMRFARVALAGLLIFSGACFAQVPSSQPTLWAGKPDSAAFEKPENGYLAAAQKDVDQVAAVKGEHTIANTLQPYD